MGFLHTLFAVTLAIYDDPIRFYLAGVVPMVLGLGLAAFALTVADVDATLARRTALRCLLGVGECWFPSSSRCSDPRLTGCQQ